MNSSIQLLEVQNDINSNDITNGITTDVYFKKVPFLEFLTSMKTNFPTLGIEDEIVDIYDKIIIPHRSTSGSAGYDFFAPFGFTLKRGESMVIPTGIACSMPINDVLLITPRSGHGFKYRLSICNTIGVIDSDYIGSDNYGHIMIKVCFDGVDKPSFNSFTKNENDEYHITINEMLPGKEIFTINTGEAFAQGLIVKYEKTRDDFVTAIRNGGFGSTNM